MFDIERFVADCRAALAAERGGGRAVREVVARAVSDPAALTRALGEPRRAGLNVLHHAPDLTVLNLVWGPGMSVMPHNHRAAAAIGIYAGREDNAFWRRIGAGEDGAGQHFAHRLVRAILGMGGLAIRHEALEVEHARESTPKNPARVARVALFRRAACR